MQTVTDAVTAVGDMMESAFTAPLTIAGSPAPDAGVVGCAIDFAEGKVWFAVNGALQNGDPATGEAGSAVTFATSPVFPMFGSENGRSSSCTANFGGSAFVHAASAGFSAWAA